ncbi:MAG TPA: PilN domain-containing protein [Candidatus Acidoferrales bacterium]|nr:PilN domain-containing protein [Candidatus Acidoferrales bacterium]
MIRINLLPVREIEAKVGRKQEALIGAACLVLIVLAAGSLYAYQAWQVSALEAELAELQQQSVQLNSKVREVAELQKKVAELREKNKIIEELEKRRAGPAKVMEGLASVTPARLWLTEFKETGGNATLSGFATDNQTIADFLKGLTQLSHFNNVELVESLQNEQESAGMKKFTIRSTVTYQAAGKADGVPKSAKP